MELEVIAKEKISLTGYEFEKAVNEALRSLKEEEVLLGRTLKDIYFYPGNEYKPLKFVYYRLIRSRKGGYALRRDNYLSPSGSKYFNTEGQSKDRLRNVIRNRESIKGKELKEVVMNLAGKPFEIPSSKERVDEVSYLNLSKQVATYIRDFFINVEKPIKDDVYYYVYIKEYGTATIYRDLEKSPRGE